MRTKSNTAENIALPPHFAHAVQYRMHEIRAEKCRRDFAFFVKEFWAEIDTEPLIWNWHLDVFCDEVMVVYRRVFDRLPKEYDLVINVPPGTSKSKIFTVMAPVWGWINDPTLKFINGSYSGDVSLEHADISRDLIKSRRFKLYFPDIKIRPDKDAKGCYHNTEKGSRYATSVGGTVTGMHAHILTIDDPLNPKKAASETELKSANHWMDQTLSTRKISKEVTPLILVMQRLNQIDPSGILLEKAEDGSKRVRHICLPGEIFDGSTIMKGGKIIELVKPIELERKYIDGMLDPVRMGKNVLHELMADLGQYGYAGQIGQQPTPPSGGMFKTEMFDVIQHPPLSGDIMEMVRWWDKAGTDAKENPGSACTAGVLMGRLRNGKYVVLDVVRGQWSTDERETRMKQTAQLDGPGVIIWMEQEPGSGGKDSARGSIKNLAGFSVHAEPSTGDKVTRADPYSVQVNWGNIQLVRAPWNREFIEEHANFPFGKRKDQVDAAGGAFNKLALPVKRAGVW